MCDVAELQKLLGSDNLSYEKIRPILDLPDNTGGGFVNNLLPNSLYLSPFGFAGNSTPTVDKLFDNLRSECLANLFLNNRESIDRLNISGLESDLEYTAMKSVLINEQNAIALVDAMMQLSPKYDKAVINTMQFAIVYGNDNIVNHILDGSPELEPDLLRRFVRFLVEFSRFDIIRRLVDDSDDDSIYEIMETDFWTDTSGCSRISNATATYRYLEEMLSKQYDKNQIKERINKEINSPYSMKYFTSNKNELIDLSNLGVTITNATLIVPFVWNEMKSDIDKELFQYTLEPMLEDKLTFSLSELVDYCSERALNDSFNISKIIIKTIELVGPERLTVNLSDMYSDCYYPDDEFFAENSIIYSINASAVKALLKIPNYCIDEYDTEFYLIEKLTDRVPRLILGLVKNGAITGKALEAVLNIAIGRKNYELLNQIRLAVPSIN